MAMMISKFHKIIQSKVVWTAFAILISIAFVGIYTGGSSNRNEQKRLKRESEVAGRLFGEDVSRKEFGQAYQRVYVLYSMRFGRAININDEVDELIRHAAWQRLAMSRKARQLGLTATPEQTIALIQSQPLFRNQQTGQFDKNIYTAFASSFLPRTGMSVTAFEQMFAEQVLIDKVAQIPAQGALVTEDEIKQAFHFYTDLLTVEYASIPRSLAEVPATTEEDAKAYFDANQEQFRMPEKAIVDYVRFAVADFKDGVSVTDEQVELFYENNKQRFLKAPAEDAPADAPIEFKPLDEVKEDIVSELTTALARRVAADQADAFVAELSDESKTFKGVAEAMSLEVIDNTPAFTQTEPVKGIDPTAPFQRAAFALEKDATHYYSDPVVGRDYVYVLSLNKKLPAFLPAFDLVKDKAMEAAKAVTAEQAYIKKAEAVHRDVTEAVKSGTPFMDAVAKYKLDVQATEPFNASTPIENELTRKIMAGTITYDQGQVADLISTSDEYVVAYVKDKIPGNEAETLPGMRPQLANSIRNEKANQLVAAWQDSLLEEAGFEDLLDRNDES